MSETKLQKYKQMYESLDGIGDKIGMPIDQGIKKTVALLNLLGFPTSGSCEGHVDVDHGLLTPWVDITPSNRKRLKRSAKQLIAEFNLWRIKKVGYIEAGFQPYLFYFSGDNEYDFRIQIGPGIINDVKKDKKQLSEESRAWLHSCYLKEMSLFTDFLWNKYFMNKVKNHIDTIGLNYYFHTEFGKKENRNYQL